MPRRQSVAHHACELCRQRKRKCDGDGTHPCKSCHETGTDCVYLATTRVSKADLREALARLQDIHADDNALLEAISSPNTSDAQLMNIIRRLRDSQPRAEVAEMLKQRADYHNEGRKGRSSSSTGTPLSPVSPGTFLCSTRHSSRSSVQSDATSPAATPPATLRFRANLSYYRSQIPQLLDTILARDCLSFCPINKKDFIHDFETGSGPHCSPALLDALLALATLLVGGRVAAVIGAHAEEMSQDELGDSFAKEAIAALYKATGLPQRIADIQALGILALYCLGCGKMKDGLGFASDFGTSITEQWGTKQSELTFDHRQAHANIYCAAISFNRSLFLIQNYNKTLDELALKVDCKMPPLYDGSGDPASTSLQASLSCSIIDDASVTRDLSLLPNNPKLIAAKLFEFTEWVYKVRDNPKTSLEQTIKVFQDCMRWYDAFFACTSRGSSETPLMMFAHTYYHFGVMCLLTPYVLELVPVDSEGNYPLKVCNEAADQVGNFTHIYSEVHNDGQLHDFMTFFKSAALAYLVICKAKIPR